MLSFEKISEIENLLKDKLRQKFQNYSPETSAKPFHTRLLGKDRMALYSFLQSLNTTFGKSIFEPVAATAAKGNFINVETQFNPGKAISQSALTEIGNILEALENAEINPAKNEEIEKIRKVCQDGTPHTIRLINVDLYLTDVNGKEYLFDLKTVKPNLGDFQKFKQTLLKWVAARLYQNPKIEINSMLALPYNPYDPQPYRRWTMRGMLDIQQDVIIGNEFWNFLGGEGTYEQLLDSFEKVGIEMREEIDEYFNRFKR